MQEYTYAGVSYKLVLIFLHVLNALTVAFKAGNTRYKDEWYKIILTNYNLKFS